MSVMVLAACAGDAELDTREGLAGPEAIQIENFLQVMLWISYVVFALVLGVTLYAWKYFRIKTDDYEEGDWPEQIHGNDKLEYTWTAVPAIILTIVSVFTISLHQKLNSDELNPITVEVAGESVTWEPQIVVVGQQWWWEYQYHFGDTDVDQERVENLPVADITTATQMVIPVGEEIELEITSRDVIHSFWIPSLNGKRDAVPGRQSAPWKIQADEPGVYFGQCTEFCGLSHSRMRMQVVALESADFQKWVTAQMEPAALSAEDLAYVDSLVAGDSAAPANAVQTGIDTFRSKCSSCHLMQGVNEDLWSAEEVETQLVAGAAPDLTHFASRTTFAGGILNVWDPETKNFNSNHISQWLRDPESLKANFAGPATDDDLRMRGMPNLGLTTEEVDGLVALLRATSPKPSDTIIAETGVE
jgi:cytochrome c oxidase subunit 2